MIYTQMFGRALSNAEWDFNFESLALRYKLLTGEDMPVTLRRNLSRPLTNLEMDSNFQSLDQVLSRLEYGEGHYPAFDQAFQGAQFLDPRFTFARSSTATYVDDAGLHTAAVNVPVFEGGLRVRPVETNLLLQSEAPDVAPWGGSGTVDLENVGTLPGSAAAKIWRFTRTSETVPLSRRQQVFTGLSGNVTFSALCFKGNNAAVGFTVTRVGSVTGTYAIYLNTETGVFTHPSQTYIVGAGYKPMLGGHLIWAALNLTETDLAYLQLAPDVTQAGGVGTYQDYATPRVNPGTGPIPYIPTTSAAVTRAADNVSIAGENFASIYNAREGAIVWEGVLNGAATNGYLYGINDNTTSAFLAHNIANIANTVIYCYGAQSTPIDLSSFDGTRVKSAVCWKGGVASFFCNGVARGLSRAITADMSVATQLRLGSLTTSASYRAPSTATRTRIFRTRPTDAQMLAMTT
uniref:phage head spike fiber domain-containing protein n=1 Tax=Castellaniella defragrans TaxID=75697 RepID=UPI00333E564E